MRERPILFSGPMVRALLAGTKTQTRRVAPIRELNILSQPGDMVAWSVSFLKAIKGVLSSHSGGRFSELQARSIIASQFCPYGQPGDRLWVRECWTHNKVVPIEHRPPGDYIYRADLNEAGVTRWAATWKPSIHMPRWASRLTLEITGVRVERLQEINETDAAAEGVATWAPGALSPEGQSADPSDQFRWLWQSINGPESWDANPWVWVVEFKRLELPSA